MIFENFFKYNIIYVGKAEPGSFWLGRFWARLDPNGPAQARMVAGPT
jgi:hypothetical protein